MSVLDKIKNAADRVNELAKEDARVTIEDDSKILVENYKSLKLFLDNEMLVELQKFDILLAGEKLVIEFFSPSRLIVSGKIKNITYMSFSEGVKEDL